MGNIVVLDELTINKIAAGEVIERPASVIKEMVENSIDAGAKNITVEIKNGGISYIRVTDDGKGIDQEDLELAFERHATSKIRSADDLNDIKSMGFRGEALASIAAISKLEMKTKTESAEIGHRVVVEGGNVIEVEEIGCPTGTMMTVENLFFNTPVRYKFLKKDYTETGYIEDVITRIALVHPEISFKLINSGKTIIQTSGDGDIKSVIYSIYGKTVAAASLNVNYTYEGITVTGVVGKPEIARSNRGNQIFFVNKRYIKDRILTNAAEKAFKGMIPIGKFGFLILNIEMSPSMVDVNVHPAKLEVRFQEEQNVFKAAYYAIQDTLLKAELIANSETPITGKLEKSKEVETEDDEEVSKEKNSITNLFRRISKNANNEFNYVNNNVIESVYKSKENNASEKEEAPKEETDIKEKVDMVSEEKTEYKADSISVEEKDESKEVKEVIEDKKEQSVDINENSPVKSIGLEGIEKILAELKSGTLSADTIKKAKEGLSSAENKEEIVIEESKNVQDEVEPKQDIDTKQEEVEANEEAEEIVDNSNTDDNAETEIEETKEVDIKEVNANVDENNLTPGDILINLAKERSNGQENVQVKDESYNFEEKFNDMYAQIFGKDLAAKKEEEQNKEANAQDIISSNMNIFEEDEEINSKIPYKFIGIAFDTYIILEIEKELYILDQHAAHERIMYEKVKKNYYSDEDKDSQLMLLPDIITLTHKEMDIARENMDKFERAGFVLEEFGENTIKLTGVPNICLDLDTKELFLETLDEINTVARTAKQEIEERFIATIACKAAVKANMALTEQEVTSLLDQLLALKNPFTCPHGRPTAIKLTKTDIEKKFARRK